MAKSKYIKPVYDDDLDKVMEILKNAKNLKIACVLNAKKETSYLFAHPLIEINKFNEKNKSNNKIINIANLDQNIGLSKIKNDAKNLLKEYSNNNITIDYITGGLDEYPITGHKAMEILKKIKPDIVVVSGAPHALFIEELKNINKDIITIGISDGPRLYIPIKEVYDYGIIELDAHAKVLGKRNIVKSRMGEILNYVNK